MNKSCELCSESMQFHAVSHCMSQLEVTANRCNPFSKSCPRISSVPSFHFLLSFPFHFLPSFVPSFYAYFSLQISGNTGVEKESERERNHSWHHVNHPEFPFSAATFPPCPFFLHSLYSLSLSLSLSISSFSLYLEPYLLPLLPFLTFIQDISEVISSYSLMCP